MHRILTLTALLCLGLFLVKPIAANAGGFPAIDDKDHNTWLWCNSCATTNGNTNATGGVANVTDPNYTIDGSSVRFDLIKNCTSPCGYGNVFFYNNLATNLSESSVTIDMFAMMDSAGVANSQAAEFTVEDNVCKSNCGDPNLEQTTVTSTACSVTFRAPEIPPADGGVCGMARAMEERVHGWRPRIIA